MPNKVRNRSWCDSQMSSPSDEILPLHRIDDRSFLSGAQVKFVSMSSINEGSAISSVLIFVAQVFTTPLSVTLISISLSTVLDEIEGSSNP